MSKSDTPARQIFNAYWNNYALQEFFSGNKEAAWAMFIEVWNLAIEESGNIAQEYSYTAAEQIIKLLAKEIYE